MTTNPYINAALASAYIVLVVFGITTLGELVGSGAEDTVMAPITMLSLLVLSVAFMAFTFFYRPVVLLLDGKRSEAVSFFVRTLAAFVLITAVVVATGFAVFV
ncbi:MAG: Uncharacterized protein Athens041674_215 [Parcubacteria group bacterium Athens0416_74]|nr:MAG: Uncharacterized protein Athens041674_215 [Parcubacteria group bacterium Athens0416_74]